MAASRSLACVLVGLAITGCSDVLPKPEYTYVKQPAPIRVRDFNTKPTTFTGAELACGNSCPINSKP